MKSFKDYFYLKESPDTVFGVHPITKQEILVSYEAFDAYAFFIPLKFENYVIYSKRPAGFHSQILNYIRQQDIDRYGISPNVSPNIKNKIETTLLNGTGGIHGQSHLVGRIWKDSKIMAIWQETSTLLGSLDVIRKYLSDIGENIEEYVFQFSISDKLIPYKDLDKKVEQTISQADIDAKRAAHLKSPLQKKAGDKPMRYQMPLSYPGKPGVKGWAMNSESNKEINIYI